MTQPPFPPPPRPGQPEPGDEQATPLSSKYDIYGRRLRPERKVRPARGWRVVRDPWYLLAAMLFFGGLAVFVFDLAAGNGPQAAPETLTTTPALPSRSSPLPPTPPSAPPATVTVVYEVTGDANKAEFISYVVDETFNIAQDSGQSLPWSKKVPFPRGVSGVTLSLAAQSGSAGSEEISCRILRDGEVVVEKTSSEPYAVVTCTGG